MCGGVAWGIYFVVNLFFIGKYLACCFLSKVQSVDQSCAMNAFKIDY